MDLRSALDESTALRELRDSALQWVHLGLGVAFRQRSRGSHELRRVSAARDAPSTWISIKPQAKGRLVSVDGRGRHGDT